MTAQGRRPGQALCTSSGTAHLPLPPAATSPSRDARDLLHGPRWPVQPRGIARSPATAVGPSVAALPITIQLSARTTITNPWRPPWAGCQQGSGEFSSL